MKQINVVAFQHKLIDSMKIRFKFHVFFVKTPYHAPTIQRKIHEPLPLVKINGKQNYKVEIFFNSKVSNRQL